MQNLSAAHRQISASTIGRYRAMATPYRDGTWNHDVTYVPAISTLLPNSAVRAVDALAGGHTECPASSESMIRGIGTDRPKPQ